ncbi:MAG TPA: 4Fe-4S binding protein [Candidatus Limnocylindrales bacterium]|jgi:formate hydrogenlyase subunit 6/NADH:ubiquinone oxidoreductase subunit I
MARDVFDRILRPLRRGPVTSRYPDVRPELPQAARGLPELDPGRCDSSGTCAEVCPTRAIAVSDGRWTLDAGACIFCGACARACPRDAIRLGHRIELAVVEVRDLKTERAVRGPS